jgi:hypothetical protein
MIFMRTAFIRCLVYFSYKQYYAGSQANHLIPFFPKVYGLAEILRKHSYNSRCQSPAGFAMDAEKKGGPTQRGASPDSSDVCQSA